MHCAFRLACLWDLANTIAEIKQPSEHFQTWWVRLHLPHYDEPFATSNTSDYVSSLFTIICIGYPHTHLYGDVRKTLSLSTLLSISLEHVQTSHWTIKLQYISLFMQCCILLYHAYNCIMVITQPHIPKRPSSQQIGELLAEIVFDVLWATMCPTVGYFSPRLRLKYSAVYHLNMNYDNTQQDYCKFW